MNRFIFSLVIPVLLLGSAPAAMAGKTTISGTMSCVMPQLLEAKPAAEESVALATTVSEPPLVAGASGNYEVQKAEKTNASEGKITVYTICAR